MVAVGNTLSQEPATPIDPSLACVPRQTFIEVHCNSHYTLSGGCLCAKRAWQTPLPYKVEIVVGAWSKLAKADAFRPQAFVGCRFETLRRELQTETGVESLVL